MSKQLEEYRRIRDAHPHNYLSPYADAAIKSLMNCGNCKYCMTPMWGGGPTHVCVLRLYEDSKDAYGLIPGEGQEAEVGVRDSCHFINSKWEHSWD